MVIVTQQGQELSRLQLQLQGPCRGYPVLAGRCLQAGTFFEWRKGNELPQRQGQRQGFDPVYSALPGHITLVLLRWGGL